MEWVRRQTCLFSAVHALPYSKLKVMENKQTPACLSWVHILCPQLQDKISQQKQEKSWCQRLKWQMGVCTYPLSQGKLPFLLSMSKFSQSLNQSEYERLHTRLRPGFATSWLNTYRNLFSFLELF